MIFSKIRLQVDDISIFSRALADLASNSLAFFEEKKPFNSDNSEISQSTFAQTIFHHQCSDEEYGDSHLSSSRLPLNFNPLCFI